jgi:hypothetical protein
MLTQHQLIFTLTRPIWLLYICVRGGAYITPHKLISSIQENTKHETKSIFVNTII